jgi:hypothetical protein
MRLGVIGHFHRLLCSLHHSSRWAGVMSFALIVVSTGFDCDDAPSSFRHCCQKASRSAGVMSLAIFVVSIGGGEIGSFISAVVLSLNQREGIR